MKSAALGFRAHSGWTALVALSVSKGAPCVLVRQRLHLVETFIYKFRQPYHTGERMPLDEAREFISRVETEARSLAYRAIRELQQSLQAQGYRLTRCGLVLASGRPLPEPVAYPRVARSDSHRRWRTLPRSVAARERPLRPCGQDRERARASERGVANSAPQTKRSHAPHRRARSSPWRALVARRKVSVVGRVASSCIEDVVGPSHAWCALKFLHLLCFLYLLHFHYHQHLCHSTKLRKSPCSAPAPWAMASLTFLRAPVTT